MYIMHAAVACVYERVAQPTPVACNLREHNLFQIHKPNSILKLAEHSPCLAAAAPGRAASPETPQKLTYNSNTSYLCESKLRRPIIR